MAPILPSDTELISLCDERGFNGINVVRLSATIIIKLGVTPAEAATQQYVWECTDPSIFRVPEPYRYFQDESRGPGLTMGYLVMEYIDGISLSTYLESATSQEQETAVNSIIKALHHLVAIPLPVGQGPGPVGGGFPRGYVWGDDGIRESFASILEMDNWLNETRSFLPRLFEESDYLPDLSKGRLDFTSEKLVMCHTDLAPRNILWLGDGQLALLDWGFAGFYPQIFEVYAFRTRVDREPIFAKILPRLTQRKDHEDQIRRLGEIEYVLLHFGGSINFNATHNKQSNTNPRQTFQMSRPPLLRPGSIV